MFHKQPSSFSGKTIQVEIDARLYPFECEDWWDRVEKTDEHWYQKTREKDECLEFVMRYSREGLPLDDEVLVGKVQGVRKLIHIKMVLE
jgi:hypothetical protein